ncbi:MAG TPA: 2OG-Fe(II) oxygenase [Blastocatellia bacterium]|nr:2OG-Fe(II) oxygenase [Blastocatellia bacterium]
MNEHDILARLGLFIRKGFLDAPLCEEIRAEMASHPSEAGYVKTADRGDFVDESLRRASLAQMPEGYAYMVRDRLDELRTDLEAFFNLRLESQEKPQFLLYETGGHYAPHRDVPAEPSERRARIEGRLISIVVFLNSQAGPHPYSGGELIFYGLSSDPRWKDYGLPLEAEPGLLVAFRSDTLHEVSPVTGGRRYTIATWFY